LLSARKIAASGCGRAIICSAPPSAICEWSDSRIIAALDTTASMVYRVRKQLVEEG
jgi:hypothetical protein